MSRYDHAIIRGDSAGCVLASRLLEDGTTVALVEAGGTVDHPCGPLGARLRLRGVAGLRAVDASVLRDIPLRNITPTVLSVAEKAAGLIREDARG